jgi:epsilon-lactone hydrolase
VATTQQAAAREAYMSLATRLAAEQAVGIVAMRVVFDPWSEEFFPMPDGTVVDPGKLGGVACETVLAPGVSAERTILHFHGGGFVIGSPRAYRAMGSVLSSQCVARLVIPDYRLAPEHHATAPIEDALAVYRALLAEGTDPARVVISGDSAGGGLALSLLIALRDAGEPLPACCVVMSPWADGTLSGASIDENGANDPIVAPEFIAALAEMRFGDDTDREDPLVSPLFAEWHGIPPLLLFASQVETLRDDAVRVAEKAREARVDATLELYDDMVRVWPFFYGQLPEADQAIARYAAFVDERLPLSHS